MDIFLSKPVFFCSCQSLSLALTNTQAYYGMCELRILVLASCVFKKTAKTQFKIARVNRPFLKMRQWQRKKVLKHWRQTDSSHLCVQEWRRSLLVNPLYDLTRLNYNFSAGVNIIKLFSPWFMDFCNKLVFVSGKLFQTRLMFAGKAGE